MGVPNPFVLYSTGQRSSTMTRDNSDVVADDQGEFGFYSEAKSSAMLTNEIFPFYI